MLSSMPTVCALLPSVSEIASRRRHDGDQKGNLPVLILRRFFCVPVRVLMLDVVLDFMLDRVHTVAHVSLHLAFGQCGGSEVPHHCCGGLVCGFLNQSHTGIKGLLVSFDSEIRKYG